jgi:hypothetical protein
MRRILTDVSEEEFRGLREIVRLLDTYSLEEPFTDWIKLEILDLRGTKTLVGSKVTRSSGHMGTRDGPHLGTAPISTRRLLHLLQANGFGQKVGGDTTDAILVQVETVQRMHDVLKP